MRTAFVTGVTGQDGGFLAARLRASGVEVHGLFRPGETSAALDGLDVVRHEGELRDPRAMRSLVEELAPDVVYNLGGISSVAQSWAEPMLTAEVTGLAPVALIEASWSLHERGRGIRFLQASSAEIFGDSRRTPQDEATPLCPISPYGAAKCFAHVMVAAYRRRGLHASNAILYNHESERRPETFVTRKITRAVAAISLGLQTSVSLGNLDVRRDWGYAPDFVDAMLRMATADRPDDFVVATGEAHSVRDFVAAAFAYVGIADWTEHLVIDQELVRPADTAVLCGDASRLRERLGWTPTVTFEEMVERMVDADLSDLRAHAAG